MKLTIRKKDKFDRPWLIVREHGKYCQHAHMHTKRDALNVRRLIDCRKYPYCKEYKVAMQRLLTEEEFKALTKNQRYFNVNKGVRK